MNFIKTWYGKIKVYVIANKIVSIIAGVFIVVGIIATIEHAGGSGTARYAIAAVQEGSITTTVTGSGQVSAENTLDLKPQGTGQIVSIKVSPGDYVKAGQTIVVLDEKSAAVSLAQAKASVASAQANYDKIVEGATQSTISSSQVSVDNANLDLLNSIKSAYTQVDNTLKTNIDPLYTDANLQQARFGLSIYDSSSQSTVYYNTPDVSLQTELTADRKNILQMMTQWNTDINNSNTDINTLYTESVTDLNQIYTFVSAVNTAANSFVTDSKHQSTVQGYISGAASARSSVNSLISNLNSAHESLVTAQSNYTTTVAPARPEDIASAKAQLDSAEAGLQSAEDNYSNNIVTAPFDGQISTVPAILGDQASSGYIAATLITKDKIATISLNEVDAAHISVGQPAVMTFDALPNLTVNGVVEQVDTVGTVTQGVVTYNVKIKLDLSDPTVAAQIKDGMSVSAIITTATKNNIIVVPSSAVKSDARGSYVQEVSGSPVQMTTGSGNGSSTGFRGGRSRYGAASSTQSTSTVATSTYAAGASSSTSTPANPPVNPSVNSFANTQIVQTNVIPTRIPVIVGISDDTNVEIVSGLQVGDKIIIRTLATSTASTARTTTGLSLLGGGAGARGAGGAGGFGGGAGGAARTFSR